MTEQARWGHSEQHQPALRPDPPPLFTPAELLDQSVKELMADCQRLGVFDPPKPAPLPQAGFGLAQWGFGTGWKA